MKEERIRALASEGICLCGANTLVRAGDPCYHAIRVIGPRQSNARDSAQPVRSVLLDATSDIKGKAARAPLLLKAGQQLLCIQCTFGSFFMFEVSEYVAPGVEIMLNTLHHALTFVGWIVRLAEAVVDEVLGSLQALDVRNDLMSLDREAKCGRRFSQPILKGRLLH